MRPVYATRFKLQTRTDLAQPDFDTVRKHVTDWVERKYKRWHGVDDFAVSFDEQTLRPVEGHEVWGVEQHLGGGQFVELRLTEPDPDEPGRVWRTSVTLATNGKETEFSIVVRVGSQTFAVQPLGAFETGPPNIVKRLVRDYVCCASEVEIASRHTLVYRDQVETLVRFILAPTRALPIVLISQTPSGVPVREARQVQDKLVGLAHVYEIDYDAGYELTNQLGKTCSCFDGAIRVYWPGFLPEAYLRHPLYLPDRIRAMTEEERPVEAVLFRRFSDIAATRYGDGPILRQLRVAADQARRDEVQKLRQAVRDAQNNPAKAEDAAWLAEFEKALDENVALREDKRRLEDQVLRLEDELAQAKQNMLAIQQHGAHGDREDIQEAVEEASLHPPTSVSDVLRRVAANSDGRLAVWKTAWSSAEASFSSRLDEVYAGVEAIAALAKDYFGVQDGAVGPWEDYFESRGLKYARGESQQTMNMHGDKRRFHDGGDEREMQKHLTIAKNNPSDCVQIYFDVDEENGRFAIGYCGPHLPTARSTF